MIADELERLVRLHDAGRITDEEFALGKQLSLLDRAAARLAFRPAVWLDTLLDRAPWVDADTAPSWLPSWREHVGSAAVAVAVGITAWTCLAAWSDPAGYPWQTLTGMVPGLIVAGFASVYGAVSSARRIRADTAETAHIVAILAAIAQLLVVAGVLTLALLGVMVAMARM